MKLLELIPCRETKAEVLATMHRFAERISEKA